MATPEHIAFARNLRQRDVPAETLLWAELRNRLCGGYKFVRQSPVAGYTVDFACRAHSLVVEVDGPSHDCREEYDRARTQALNAAGYEVLRLRNDDVFADIDACREAIFQVLENANGRNAFDVATPSSAPSGHLLPQGRRGTGAKT